jgi:hypothetical protein
MTRVLINKGSPLYALQPKAYIQKTAAQITAGNYYTLLDAANVEVYNFQVYQANDEAAAKFLNVKAIIDGREITTTPTTYSIANNSWRDVEHKTPYNPSANDALLIGGSGGSSQVVFGSPLRGTHVKLQISLESVKGTNQVLEGSCLYSQVK